MLVAVSASHEHLDLEVLEALTRGSDRLPALLTAADTVHGAVVLSTCNRLEIYLDAERFHDAVATAVDAVVEASGLGRDEVLGSVDAFLDADAARHLYEVMAGLRSLVVGESEIAGQVRTAFQQALAEGHSTDLLSDLFQVGLRHAKQVAATTGLGAAGRTGGAVALDRAADALDVPLDAAKVLVIGTGSYARVITAELRRRGTRAIAVHSGTGRAQAFARTHEVTAVGPAALSDAVTGADLVVAASGRGGVLRADHLAGRRGRRLVVLDLALHSDLAPELRERPDLTIITLADLAHDVDDEAQKQKARDLLAAGVETFAARRRMRRVDPAIRYLRGTVSGALQDEVAALRTRHGEEVADDVERSLRRIAAKLLHSPTARARELARDGQAEQYVAAFHTLFGVDVRSGVDVRGGVDVEDGPDVRGGPGVRGSEQAEAPSPKDPS